MEVNEIGFALTRWVFEKAGFPKDMKFVEGQDTKKSPLLSHSKLNKANSQVGQ